MAKCESCVHYAVCVKLGKPALYGINKELGCDNYFEVVRCKDCKHCLRHTVPLGAYGYCNHFGYYDYAPEVKPDDFCSYGERRNDGSAQV